MDFTNHFLCQVQSLIYSHEASEVFADYVNDPIHADAIQESLVKMANRVCEYGLSNYHQNLCVD